MDIHQRYRRIRTNVTNFKIKDLSTRTLLITAGVLAAIVVIPTTISYLPNQNSSSINSSSKSDNDVKVVTLDTGVNSNGTIGEIKPKKDGLASWSCYAGNNGIKKETFLGEDLERYPCPIYGGVQSMCTDQGSTYACMAAQIIPTTKFNKEGLDWRCKGDKSGMYLDGASSSSDKSCPREPKSYCLDIGQDELACAIPLPLSGGNTPVDTCDIHTGIGCPAPAGSCSPCTGAQPLGGGSSTVACGARSCEKDGHYWSCNNVNGVGTWSNQEGSCITGGGTGSGGGTAPTPVPIATQPPAQSLCSGPYCDNVNFYGNDVGHYNNATDNNGYPATAQDCQIGCQQDARCVAWTFQKDTKDCWLKGAVPAPNSDTNTTSGIKSGNAAPPPASNPPASNSCTGDAKVLCGTQCYGVVAGACKTSWKCPASGSGTPVCQDNATPLPTVSHPTNPPANNGGSTGGSTAVSCVTACQGASPAGSYCGSGNAVNNQCSCTLCSVKNTPAAQITPGATIGNNPVTKTINTASSNQPNATSTPIAQATNTPTVQATTTPPANAATIAMSISIPGVGTNTSGRNNNSPTPSSRSLEVQVVDSSGTTKSASGQLTYDTTSGTFKGNVSVSNLVSGTYTVKARFNNALWKAIKGVSFTANQTTTAPATELTTGDINQDNLLNLIDYNLLISCFGSKTCDYKTQSDLNMDGKVNEIDLNILYSEFTIRNGE